MLAFRKYYFKDWWNIIDFCIVIMSVVDVFLDVFTEGPSSNFSPAVLKLSKVLRIFRMGRLLKLMKVSHIVTMIVSG